MKDLFKRDVAAVSNIMKLRFHPLVAKSAKGVYIEGEDGKQYLDFCSGWGVANTGYAHPKIQKAIEEQLNKLSFASTCSLISEPVVRLAEELIQRMPGDFEKKAWFGLSGSDANEMIYKAIPIYTGKNKIITFVGSYHGQTLGSYSMSGHPMLSKDYGANVIKVPYPYSYRCPFSDKEDECGQFCIKYFEDYILGMAYSPDDIGAMVVETMQCDGGDIPMPKGYLKAVERICRKHNILLIVDDVKIGFGRTGDFFSFEYEGVCPDAVVLGKPIASGQSLSAVVGRKEFLDVETGLHLFTTGGSPVACAAALATIEIIESEKLLENTKRMGEMLMSGLRALMAEFGIIGDVRGRGLIIGVEIVEDKASKKPAPRLAQMISYRAYELGLLFYTVGIYSNVLELMPPLIISEDDVGKALSIIKEAIRDVLEGNFDEAKLEEFSGWGI